MQRFIEGMLQNRSRICPIVFGLGCIWVFTLITAASSTVAVESAAGVVRVPVVGTNMGDDAIDTRNLSLGSNSTSSVAKVRWPVQASRTGEAMRGRRLLTYTDLSFVPAIDTAPPGGGPPSLYAGVNYTRWILTADDLVHPGGKVMLVTSDLNPRGAEAGHCPRYIYGDITTPIDGQVAVPAVGNAHVWSNGMVFMQGGNFRFCWSNNGTFKIADGMIVPLETSIFRIFGAFDTCDAGFGFGCLANRRFFCHVPHRLYEHYGPIGTQCYIFIQASNTPLLYTRLTWMGSQQQCGGEVGRGMAFWSTDWAREVNPLKRIDLGKPRFDLTEGFHHRLCFCPVYDASIDGVCGEPSDFVQQVGHLDGLVLSFLAVDGDPRVQVLPMTRFTIRVDCGGGPRCAADTYPRIKVIAKGWDPVETNTDLMHWDPGTGCPGAPEVAAWYSPSNCKNISTGKKLAAGCMLEGGTSETEKLFGIRAVHMSPKLEAGIPVAQIFDVCFVHKPLDIDGTSASGFDPAGNKAMQNPSRVFWKVGQLVVEPWFVRDPGHFVVNKPLRLAIGPPGRTRTSILHGSVAANRTANGTYPAGPVLKLIQEAEGRSIDNTQCGALRTLESLVDGLLCPNTSWCFPRAVRSGSDLVLSGAVTIKKAGVFAVCYCESWPFQADSCDNYDHWVLVGKVLVQGPLGDQEWILDTGMSQSFFIEGIGLDDRNTVIILRERQLCNELGFSQRENSVRICTPGLQGRCQVHATETNGTHIADIPGSVQRHNSTDPMAYIHSVVPDPPGKALVKFAQVPLLEAGDRLHLESNIEPLASHWVRKRDLERVVKGADDGFVIEGVLDAGLTARITFELDPFPPLVITPSGQGKWWRSNRLRVPLVKGTRVVSQLPVCWSDGSGQYFSWVGYLNFENPSYLKKLLVGLTSTAAGSASPVQISFRTSDNPKYTEPRNSMQLRLTFTNTSIMEPADAGVNAERLTAMANADQAHEASQAVCGKLFVELWSNHPFGFPVPKGCYADLNRYESSGRIQSFYIVFDPLNGLQADADYTLVVNTRFPMPVADYSSFKDPPLIEVAALDDMINKPEGIVDVGWANPDKPVVEPVSRDPGNTEPRFFQDGISGITLRTAVSDYEDHSPPPEGSSFVQLKGDSAGMSFLLRGDTVGRILPRSKLRVYFMPLTAWNFNYRDICRSDCVPQLGHTCGSMTDCSYEAAQSTCEDFIPPKARYWVDTRGRECKWYAEGNRCGLDGTSYTPNHGFTALFACCVCNGGVRSNHNILKLTLPADMDPAFGSAVIHTIRFWGLKPMPKRSFFASRFGVQLTNVEDRRPDYTTTAGRYVIKEPDGSVSPVLTLVNIEGWGNTRQFKGDAALNDFYARLTLPATLFATPAATDAHLPSPASFEISLPEGYDCKYVLPAMPRGSGDDLVPLPVLAEDSPTGNGALPASTSAAGGNTSAIGGVLPSGSWVMHGNRISFHLAPWMALFAKQQLFLHIFARNPMQPLPRNDPRNYWAVNFTSSGRSDEPPGHARPCLPFAPPVCSDTGERYFVNPVGYPAEVRTFERLYPNTTMLSATFGPFRSARPTNLTLEPYALNYTSTFAVLGILKDTVLQPTHFHLGSRNTLRIWFVPDIGSDQGGYLGIQLPAGFAFAHPCVAQDLPLVYYRTYAPPREQGGPRVWPLQGIGACQVRGSPSWSRGGVYLSVHVDGAMLAGRLYGLAVHVINPPVFGANADDPEAWWFKADISDDERYGRDGTYSTFVQLQNGTQPWRLYSSAFAAPIMIQLNERRPFAWTGMSAILSVSFLRLLQDTRGQLRVIAPEGYAWAWDPSAASTFIFAGLLNQTRPMPGGVPPLPLPDRQNVMAWLSHDDLYEAGQNYGFRTLIRVPSMPPRASANSFFFELGYNGSSEQRIAAAEVPAGKVRSLRAAKVEASSTLAGDASYLWLRIETVTPIPPEGALQVQISEQDQAMTFASVSTGHGRYCIISAVEQFGSKALPSDILCKRISYLTGVRLELSANISGIPPGYYVIEFRVTNPPDASVNQQQPGSPCGRESCFSFHTLMLRSPVILRPADGEWASNQVPNPSSWTSQLDYWTAIPALRITGPMAAAAILNLTLNERLACGRNDGPGRRSALVFAFALDSSTPTDKDELRIRAPVGWRFDHDCGFRTARGEVMPLPASPPRFYSTLNLSTGEPISWEPQPWPEQAVVRGCFGDGHEASVHLDASKLQPRQLYLFRLGVRRNPDETPKRNTWSLTLGAESSGPIPGFPVWTFQPLAIFRPILRAWTEKANPKPAPVAFEFAATNFLYKTELDEFQPSVVLAPMIRLIMPPLFEVVVDGPDQDIQGGVCFVVLEQMGDCRLCGVPLPGTQVSCSRETNRKNVATVYLFGGAVLHAGFNYSISITVFNPHVPDARDAPPRTWTIESFLGKPAPPAQAPEGYALDYKNVSGFLITGKATLSVESTQQRNASEIVNPKLMTMKFEDILKPGDKIELRAPPGFKTSRLIVGLVSRIVCIGFVYLPTIWPTNLSTHYEEVLIEPPKRPPAPPEKPAWSLSGAKIVQLPLNDTANQSGELLAAELPQWTLGSAQAAQDEALANSSHAFLVLGNHCLPGAVHGEVDWTDIPKQAHLSVSVRGGLASAAIDATDMTWTHTLPSEVELCLHAHVQENVTAPLHQVSEHCASVPIETLPPAASPLVVQVLQPSKHQPPACVTSAGSSSAKSNIDGDGSPNVQCTCGSREAVIIQVLWHTAANLSAHLEFWQNRRKSALDLELFDTFPLRVEPQCLDNVVTWTLGPEDIHPETELLNGTTFRFRLAWQNSRRPPMPHQNFWILNHLRGASVAASDVVESWPVVSRLRYVVIDLLTEVLKPTDPAELHFEFVTVSPATRLLVRGEYPQFYDFTNANVSSNGQTLSRRLLWKGFTTMVIHKASGNDITLGFNVQPKEYVRFRLGRVSVPSMGGQALFSLFTWIHDIPQDAMELCCPPGYPPANPGRVFRIPHRVASLWGSLQSEYHQVPALYPIASTMAKRLDEECLVSFTFQVTVRTQRPSAGDPLLMAVRAPAGYEIKSGLNWVYDSAQGGATGSLRQLPSYMRYVSSGRAEVLLLEQEALNIGVDYKIVLEVHTPKLHADRVDRRLWVLEVTDTKTQGSGERPRLLDVYDDFALYAPVNITVAAERSPPEVVIEATVVLVAVGENAPNRVDIFAPSGFRFLPNCFSPGQLDGSLKDRFVSCKERLTLFQANYLSTAVMMTKDLLDLASLPLALRLLLKTPAITPIVNRWYARISNRQGLLGWGMQTNTFPVRPMQMGAYFPAISMTEVPFFLEVKVRYPLPHGGHIHVAGPRLYQLRCPVTRVLSPSGFVAPFCSSQDPILTGCWGLPTVHDPDPPPGLPLCDPKHELLLTFPRVAVSGNASYAVWPGTVLVMALNARVARETPRPRVENVFRVRILDEGKVAMDGHLAHFTYNVIQTPRVGDLTLWWTNSAPGVTMTVVVGFSFHDVLRRSQEKPGQRLRVIEIWTPEGIRMAVRQPAHVKNLRPNSQVPVTSWNWTTSYPRTLWFGLDERRDVSGIFQYAFPVLTSLEEPATNLWQIKFCADTPFCFQLLLSVPQPGFRFGEQPSELDPEARAVLIGSSARLRALATPWLPLLPAALAAVSAGLLRGGAL